jgi:hypothetical protein
MRPRISAKGFPKTVMVPERRGTMPSTAFMSVDFPAPLGPTMVVSVPAPTVMSTENTAGFSP